MHFGEPIDEQRLAALLRPGGGIDTVITADVYGEGAADALLGARARGPRSRVLSPGRRGRPRLRRGRARRPARLSPLHRPAPARRRPSTPSYLRRATEASLERLGAGAFDLLLLHNPDRTGFRSEAVWDGMAALRDAGLTEAIGIAPGPANGFTLDLIDCFERFGDRIDWAMVILNPLEPWPGELCLAAAAEHGVRVITRVVDYGGLFWDDVLPGPPVRRARPPPLPPRGLGRGRAASGSSGCARSPSAPGLTPIQLACQWNLAHPAVACAAPTLIQEPGPEARADRGQAGRARGAAASSGWTPPRSPRSARSATTSARWRSRARAPTTRATSGPTAGR